MTVFKRYSLMKYVLLFLILIFILACSGVGDGSAGKGMMKDSSNLELRMEKIPDSLFIDSLQCGFSFTASASYSAQKRDALELREKLRAHYVEISDSLQRTHFQDSALQLFTLKLLDKIIPHWYGTPWTFEGHTNVPNDGEVACGYFVSTTLKHMGLNVNRYKLAQQSAANAGKSLALGVDMIAVFRSSDFYSLFHIINKLDEGLYVVGLDYHVGYFLKNRSGSYFIHSDYIGGYVKAEVAYASPAFVSEIYHFTQISTNRTFIDHWLLGKEILVIMD